MVNLCSSIFI